MVKEPHSRAAAWQERQASGRGPRRIGWRPWRAFRAGRLLPLALLAGLVLLFAVWELAIRDRGARAALLSNLGGLLVGAVALFVVAAAAQDALLPGRLRRFWRWLGSSLAVFWLGDAWFLAEKLARQGGLVGASPADAMYLASYPLAAVALLTASGWKLEPEHRAAFLLDVAIVALGGAALAWHVFVRPTLAGGHGTSEFTAAGYVVCDLALLGLFAVRALDRGAWPAGFLLIGVALLLRLGANGLYWHEVLSGVRSWSGRVASAAYAAAWLAFALSALVQARWARRKRWRRHPGTERPVGSALPTVAAAVGYLVLAAAVARRSNPEFGFLVLIGVSLTAAVLARQLVAVREAGRIHAEGTARANETRFRSLVENASDIVLVIGDEGRIRYHTPSADRFMGRAAAGLEGVPLVEFVHPEDRDLVAALLQDAVLKPGAVPSAEWRLRWSDRGFRWVEGRAKSVPGDPALDGIILTLRSIHERKQLEDRLAYQAFHDPLTNLPNRVLLAERLEHAFARATRSGDPVSVLFVDLDEFKRVNDSLGHAVGDQLLVEVSRRLLACVRSADTPARLGGDEFAVLVEEGGVAAAEQVAARVAEAVREPFRAAGREIVLGASIGIASSQRGASTAGDLLRNADIAMYQAKHSGKGRLVVFEPGMQAAVRDRLEMEDELRGVLVRNELRMFYQPIVALDTGRAVGAEALLRWEHPKRGLLCPPDFLEAAGSAGAMPAIGHWTVERVCSDASAWPVVDAAAELPIACLNVAPGLLGGRDFVAGVERAVAASGMPPGRLVLELTESAAVEDAPATFAAMRTLRAHGVKVAIDDFGTGYSSLSYLREMPADILKLDRAFVENLDHDRHARALARGILDLARALGKQVIAEGIEQEPQAARLRELGCTLGQGFLFARAVPEETLLRLLHSSGRDAPG